ncbi:MAG TPA: hypothetical protein VNY10_08510 [Roseiarcus sp.]|jgi:predicted DNA-binding transcriptional regulator AlpA|nr:hypothetical protein [Roseiarcus sp.]
MKALLRYSDLVARNVVNSRAQLARLQKNAGFPIGRMLSVNTRTWTELEIDTWYESRPTENARPLQGRAAQLVKDASAPQPHALKTAKRKERSQPAAAE